MWPVPFLTEGLIIGVLVAWFRWRCEWPAKLRVAVMLVLCALILVGCATPAELDIAPDTKAMRWQGACEICMRAT